MMMKGDDANHLPEQMVQDHLCHHLDVIAHDAVDRHPQDEIVPKIVESDEMGGSSYRLNHGRSKNHQIYCCDLECSGAKRQEVEGMV
jgi:hypothetical protein